MSAYFYCLSFIVATDSVRLKLPNSRTVRLIYQLSSEDNQ